MRMARPLPACLVLALLAGGHSVSADGWSPCSICPSARTTETTECSSKTSKKEPSVLQKLGTGTKNFVTGVTDALTLKKKPAVKKSISPYASAMKSSSNSRPQKKSWLGSLFQAEEPKKQKMTPTDWIDQQRVDW